MRVRDKRGEEDERGGEMKGKWRDDLYGSSTHTHTHILTITTASI